MKAEPWGPVLGLGVVSLLTAIAGEAARGVSGPFLKQLGATAAAVGVIAGAGELLGYTLRLGAGFLADRSRRAWRLLLAGTVLGIAAVPLLSIVPGWRSAAALYLIERIGRAVRTPARDVLLSSASEPVGHGPGFGIHRLLDQTGAVIGPLAMAALYSAGTGYRAAFAMLFLPSLGGVAMLGWVHRRYPELGNMAASVEIGRGSRLPVSFWWLCAIAGLLAAGTADFALISYHFVQRGGVAPADIPLLYALAMALEGVAAAGLGFVLPRLRILALLITIGLSIVAPPLLFAVNVAPVIGVAAWSMGMGGQYAILRALVPSQAPPHARGTAFGWFNTVFGICWFAGSAAMGFLYARNLTALVWFAVGSQLAAAPIVVGMAVTRSRRA